MNKNFKFLYIILFILIVILFQFSFSNYLFAQEITYSGIQFPLDNATIGKFSFSASHPGVDYLVYDQNGIPKSGDPVHAIANGEVIKKNYEEGGYGNYVVIKHNINGVEVYSLYAHLLNFEEIPNVGPRVINKGDIIGHVGATGKGSNNIPHLHFELRTKAAFVNEKGEEIWLQYRADTQELSTNLNKYFYEPDSFIRLQQESDKIILNITPSQNAGQSATLIGNLFGSILNGLKNIGDFFINLFNPQNQTSSQSVAYAASQESQQSITASIESAKVVTETTAPIPAPSKPSLISPYNWYQSLGVPPNLIWNGDSNSAYYYVVVNSSNTGNVESGWITSTSWKPNLPNQNYIYTWKVKAKNSQGVEGPWSDESHFSIASTTLKFEGDISFSPPSPSSADQIKIFASTTGWGGVGVTLRVSVNAAPDSSSNGEWKILKELGVPKFNENDAPEWNTQGWSNGTYRVRVEAKGPNDPYWQNPAVIETMYKLIDKPTNVSESTSTTSSNNQVDLGVSNIKFYEPYTTNEITPQAGNAVTAFAVLKNNGGQETGIFNVKWFLDGQEVGYGSHASLKPGEVSDGNIRYNWQVTAGSHTFSFVADCDNHVGETNEENNNFKITVNVSTESTTTTINVPSESTSTTIVANTEPNIINVVVSGTLDWQSTGVTVNQGQQIQIVYKDGTWAGRVGFGPSLPDIWTDAGGIDFQIYYPEFGVTGRFASLIGKIGDGPIIQVGSSYNSMSTETGTLFLRMFDTDMSDNAGSINIQVIVKP
jgi:hypothetical protein